MSALTPEAARAAAEWLDNVGNNGSAKDLRAEADRLEVAARTAGQVLAEGLDIIWRLLPTSAQASYERAAAAVIDHHVGPDRVVVDKYLVKQAWETIDNAGRSGLGDRLREALS